ncbi:uncharacterized protein LOC134268289 [Saccostrea cucullata]|uniref:uncharacterized protein LOC134268289 n=1 Tax=Saccostrea cuccullata TaxID=36930 RepID=UPI002ED19D1B
MKTLPIEKCFFICKEVVFIAVLLIEFCFLLCTMGNPIESYDFKVYPVDACPANMSAFESAATRMNCSNRTRYLCTPDRKLTSLIEFCTDRPRKPYGPGFCVRLEGSGDLNHDYNCTERFSEGCPSTHYFDNEIYKFPECLKIDKKRSCFTADRNCSRIPRYTNSSSRDDTRIHVIVPVCVVIVLIIIVLVVLLLLLRHFKKTKKEKENPNIRIDELKHFLSKKNVQVYHARFIIVGCAQAGKTTLLKRLQDKPFREVKSVEQTHGVDVHVNSFEMLGDTIRGINTKEEFEMPNIIFSEEDVLRGKDDKDDSLDDKNEIQNHISAEHVELHPLLLEQSANSDNYSIPKEGDEVKGNVSISRKSSISVEWETETTVKEYIPKGDVGVKEETKDLENDAMMKILNAVIQIGKEKRNPRITFLDFAGQNAYYAFHQVYLSPKTFFILVIDMTKKFTDKNENDASGGSRFTSWTYKDYYKFWLKSIDSFSDVDTPVIVVASHAENKSKQECQQFFEEFFELFDKRDELRRHLHADRRFAIKFPENESKLEDVNEIKNCIASLVKKSKYWKLNMRSAWAIFENIVEQEKKQRKILSRDRLSMYIRSLQPEFRMSEDEITEMLLFLHRVGALLYIDEENVRNTIILDVQWFVNAFKYIITDSVSMHEPTDKDRKRFCDTGELSDKELEQIWKKHYKSSQDFSDHKKEILSFMEQLCLLAVCSAEGSSESGEGTWYYFPCMNKRNFKPDSLKNHSRSSILCFQFDEQGQLPIFLFYGLVLKCLKLPGWTFLTEKKSQRCIYEDAACYLLNKHIVVLCICKFQIQVQVCVPKGSFDPSATVLKEVQESIEKKIEEFKKYSYKVGYKCQNGSLFNEKDNSFIEQESFPLERFVCDKCSVDEKHYVDNNICWVKKRESAKLEYICKTPKCDGDANVRWTRQTPMVCAKPQWLEDFTDAKVR